MLNRLIEAKRKLVSFKLPHLDDFWDRTAGLLSLERLVAYAYSLHSAVIICLSLIYFHAVKQITNH